MLRPGQSIATPGYSDWLLLYIEIVLKDYIANTPLFGNIHIHNFINYIVIK